MTVLNFPASPALNATYTENNVTYTWNGNYWEANNTGSLDNIYVEIAGDVMTGNLLLPGGGGNTAALQKQEIDALIEAGDVAGDHWDRSGGTLSPKDDADNVEIGSGTITLNAANGSSQFVGSMKIGTTGSFTPSTPAIRLNADGNIYAAGEKFSVTANATKIGDNTGSTSQNSSSVVNKSEGTVSIFHQNGSTKKFLQCLENGVSPRVEITSDGSGVFQGEVMTSNRFVSYNQRPNRFEGIVGDVLELKTNNDNADYALKILNASGEPRVTINGYGAAKFSSTITGPTGDATSGTIPFLYQRTKDTSAVTESQSIIFSRAICRAGSSNAFTYWRVSGGGTGSASMGNWGLHASRGNDTALSDPAKITLRGNGSATFLGDVTANGKVLTRNVELHIEADDPTKYTADVDEEGNETQTYIGATLDVQESIETAAAARAAMRETFQELLVAVQSATDFGELKSAMLVALEDYAA